MTDPSRIAALERELARVNDLLALVSNELATSEAKLRAAESLAATARRDAFEEAAKKLDEEADSLTRHLPLTKGQIYRASILRQAAAKFRSLATVPGGDGKD